MFDEIANILISNNITSKRQNTLDILGFYTQKENKPTN